MADPQRKREAREAKQDLYRQLILTAAEFVFAEKGYDQAKMDEIARESGLSPGTVYTVFKGKADVFQALHKAGDAELLRRGIEFAQGLEDPFELLLAGIRGYLDYFLTHPNFLRMHLLEGFTWGTEQSGADNSGRTDAWKSGIKILALSIERCIEAEIFHPGDPEILARMMIAMQQVQLAHWVENGMERDPEVVINEIETQLRRSFCLR